MAAVNPNLVFNGDCEEAFNFYQSVFGGEPSNKVRFKDMPMGQPIPESAGDKIMHVSLPIGDTILMGSDSQHVFGGPATSVGSNFSISVNAESEKEADKIFNGLAAGGKTTMPLGKAPWNAYFGMCTDKFGIEWMVNHFYEQPK